MIGWGFPHNVERSPFVPLIPFPQVVIVHVAAVRINGVPARAPVRATDACDQVAAGDRGYRFPASRIENHDVIGTETARGIRRSMSALAN